MLNLFNKLIVILMLINSTTVEEIKVLKKRQEPTSQTQQCVEPCHLKSKMVTCKIETQLEAAMLIAKACFKNAVVGSEPEELVIDRNAGNNDRLTLTRAAFNELQYVNGLKKLTFTRNVKIAAIRDDALTPFIELEELNVRETGVSYSDLINSISSLRRRLKRLLAGQGTNSPCSCEWYIFKNWLEDKRIVYTDGLNPKCDEFDLYEAKNMQSCPILLTPGQEYMGSIAKIHRVSLCIAIVTILFCAIIMMGALLCALSKPFNWECELYEQQRKMMEIMQQQDRIQLNPNCFEEEPCCPPLPDEFYDPSLEKNYQNDSNAARKKGKENRPVVVQNNPSQDNDPIHGHIIVETPGNAGPRVRLASGKINVNAEPSRTGTTVTMQQPLGNSGYNNYNGSPQYNSKSQLSSHQSPNRPEGGMYRKPANEGFQHESDSKMRYRAPIVPYKNKEGTQNYNKEGDRFYNHTMNAVNNQQQVQFCESTLNSNLNDSSYSMQNHPNTIYKPASDYRTFVVSPKKVNVGQIGTGLDISRQNDPLKVRATCSGKRLLFGEVDNNLLQTSYQLPCPSGDKRDIILENGNLPTMHIRQESAEERLRLSKGMPAKISKKMNAYKR